MAAKKTDGVNVAAMQKIIALLKTRHDEDGALIEELERLAGGGRGIGEIMKDCYAHWNALWPHGTYVFKFDKDAPQMKRLIRQLGGTELQQRMLNYLKSRDPYYAEKKHPFPLFVATVNAWANDSLRPEDLPIPVGCTHQPPCHDDVEHTRKKQQAMRS